MHAEFCAKDLIHASVNYALTNSRYLSCSWNSVVKISVSLEVPSIKKQVIEWILKSQKLTTSLYQIARVKRYVEINYPTSAFIFSLYPMWKFKGYVTVFLSVKMFLFSKAQPTNSLASIILSFGVFSHFYYIFYSKTLFGLMPHTTKNIFKVIASPKNLIWQQKSCQICKIYAPKNRIQM